MLTRLFSPWRTFWVAVAILLGSVLVPWALGRRMGDLYEDGQLMTYVSPALLLVGSVFSWRIFWLRKRTREEARSLWESPVLFWLWVSLGFLVLAIDELTSLHTKVARAIIVSVTESGVPVSDVFYEMLPVSYAMIGLLVLVFYGQELVAFPKGRLWLFAGIAGFLVALLLNLINGKTVPLPPGRVFSDMAKLFGEVCMIVMMGVIIKQVQCRLPEIVSAEPVSE